MKTMSDRRCFVDLSLCIVLALLSGAFTTHSLRAADRPNLVLIFADDLGWQETGFTGSDYCETLRDGWSSRTKLTTRCTSPRTPLVLASLG